MHPSAAKEIGIVLYPGVQAARMAAYCALTKRKNGDLSEHHACDFGSGCPAKIEKHLSAPLGVKNGLTQ